MGFGDERGDGGYRGSLSGPGEDEQARTVFNQAVMRERGRQAAKGYDAAHDDAHGLDHLLMWSQRYASRGEHVKSQALVQAAREYIARHAAQPTQPTGEGAERG